MEKVLAKLTDADKQKIDEIISRYPDTSEKGYIITMLHDIQKAFDNSLPGAVIKYLSAKLNVPETKLHGVITFYTMFSTEKRGINIIRLCESPPCHLMGAANLLEVLKEELGIEVGETTTDKKFTLETTACLGVCSVAPAMMINEEVYGNLTKEKIKEILQKY